MHLKLSDYQLGHFHVISCNDRAVFRIFGCARIDDMKYVRSVYLHGLLYAVENSQKPKAKDVKSKMPGQY